MGQDETGGGLNESAAQVGVRATGPEDATGTVCHLPGTANQGIDLQRAAQGAIGSLEDQFIVVADISGKAVLIDPATGATIANDQGSGGSDGGVTGVGVGGVELNRAGLHSHRSGSRNGCVDRIRAADSVSPVEDQRAVVDDGGSG